MTSTLLWIAVLVQTLYFIVLDKHIFVIGFILLAIFIRTFSKNRWYFLAVPILIIQSIFCYMYPDGIESLKRRRRGRKAIKKSKKRVKKEVQKAKKVVAKNVKKGIKTVNVGQDDNDDNMETTSTSIGNTSGNLETNTKEEDCYMKQEMPKAGTDFNPENSCSKISSDE